MNLPKIHDDQQSKTQNTKTEDPHKELDDLIGHLGWYQAVVCLSVLGALPFIGVNGTLPVFEAARPAYRCSTCLDSVNLDSNITEFLIEERFFENSLDDCGEIVIDKCKVQSAVFPGLNETGNDALRDCCYREL